MRKFQQGRIIAEDEDHAAMKIRDKYDEHVGKLVVIDLPGFDNWYEYMLELTQ